jgi:signal transduction histidine kinase
VYPKKLLRNSAFRIALGYVALFGVSALLLLGFIYWSTASYMQQQADETIDAEIVGLEERYRLTGLAGLTQSIRERLNRRPAGSSIYLLTDGMSTPIVGNLDRWPTAEVDADGWMSFELTVMRDEPKHRVRAKPFALPGGFRLLVGRDMYELQTMRSRLVRTLGWGLALTVGLALAGGVVMSRSRVRRIGAINDAIGEVMEGDLSRRIPAESTGGDIEELVTRLNHMLDELEKLVEGVRRVSDNIAHDLRTPLARLKTRLERLRYAGVGDEAEKAVEEADKLLATFAALLRIARIESGERRDAFQPVDLTGLIDDVAELYRPLIEEQNKKFIVHNAPDVAVSGDRDMLFQAVANLLDNALKHTPAQGRVELSLGKTDGHIDIVVADDGRGIPEHERAKVIDRFYRLDESRTTPGAGLGLSLVAAVVDLHHGELQLEDNPGGPGLRVVMKLPAAA